MQLSTIPFLLTGLLGFVGWLALRAERRGSITGRQRWAILSVLIVLAAWAALSAYLALRGIYSSNEFLQWLPGLWLPLIPFAIIGAAVAAFGTFRRALHGILDATPPVWLVYLQAARISAIGTLIKTLQGKFPIHFELGVGLPDLLFGLSALWMARAVNRGRIGWRGLAIWNVSGFVVVALPALFLMQMGLPGPMQMFTGPPASEALLVYPMALAPTVIVPFFLLMNVWVAAWLMTRQPETLAAPPPHRTG